MQPEQKHQDGHAGEHKGKQAAGRPYGPWKPHAGKPQRAAEHKAAAPDNRGELQRNAKPVQKSGIVVNKDAPYGHAFGLSGL